MIQNLRQFSIFAFALLISVLSIPPLHAEEDEFFKPHSTLGGYGELHMNYQPAAENMKLDFHRFVLFYGYAWTSQWSLKSEVEIEHNFVSGGNGELELEQAYVNYMPNSMFNFQMGVLLPSVGLMNESHEPPLFFGVERPGYHNSIIPTTWFGNGIASTGIVMERFDYKVVLMEGLNSARFSAGSGLRSGRIKGFNSTTDNILANLRLDYIGLPGLRAGVSYSRNHLLSDTGKIQKYEGANIVEAHGKYKARGVFAVAELGTIGYESIAKADGELKRSFGYYVQGGYNVFRTVYKTAQLYPFVSYSQYNPGYSLINDPANEAKNETSEWALGIHYQPIEHVVFKTDFGKKNVGKSADQVTVFNIGAGYQF